MTTLVVAGALVSGSGEGGVDPGAAVVLGRRLRCWRRDRGLSQTQLAQASTLSVRAIRDLENGRVRQPRADTLRLLADALQVSVPQLTRVVPARPPGRLPGLVEPVSSGPFLGRGEELHALTTMLGSGQHRRITVTGIEGVGKTRLAMEAAHALHTTGRVTVVWLGLDDKHTAGWCRHLLHPNTHNNTHNNTGDDSGGGSGGGGGGGGGLAASIGDSDCLLVLDGAGGQEDWADTTTRLLAACPRLRILLTARTAAGMPVDTLFPLTPLDVPAPWADTTDLDQVPSVALVLAQSRRIHPSRSSTTPQVLTAIGRICRALDGLPAALETAAHWSLIYTPEQLAHQLETDPLSLPRRPGDDHHQARAFTSIDHTITALNTRQRRVLAAIAEHTPHTPHHPHGAHGPHDAHEGYCSVLDIAQSTGIPAADCAEDLHHLLILGLIRRLCRHDAITFQVLNVVLGAADQHAAA